MNVEKRQRFGIELNGIRVIEINHVASACHRLHRPPRQRPRRNANQNEGKSQLQLLPPLPIHRRTSQNRGHKPKQTKHTRLLRQPTRKNGRPQRSRSRPNRSRDQTTRRNKHNQHPPPLRVERQPLQRTRPRRRRTPQPRPLHNHIRRHNQSQRTPRSRPPVDRTPLHPRRDRQLAPRGDGRRLRAGKKLHPPQGGPDSRIRERPRLPARPHLQPT